LQGRLEVAVETRGIVHIRGETTPGVEVEVLADGVRISLLHHDELVGDWKIGDIGIQSLHEGFSIRAEGEEFILKTDDDVALAREMGIVAASPRLARKIAASQNPDRPMPADPEAVKVSSTLGVIGFALGGVMTIAGGVLLQADTSGGEFWSAFVLGGLLLIGVAVAMALEMTWSRTAAISVVAVMVVLFGLSAQSATPDADHLLAYGFIAGGVVIGIATIFAGSFGEPD
jgi:hypothetical protein